MLQQLPVATRNAKRLPRVNGQEAVELAVYKEGDANTVQIANRLKNRLETITEDMPDDLDLITVFDQSKFISQAINDVKVAAIAGGIIAMLILYFFLGNARATFIIGIAIPVSVVGTFLMMYTSDITLNIMSLGGIALAIGMLVDNSIVVLENIVRKREQGYNLLESARAGTHEVAAAVTAATLTTIAVFFPMVFVTGIAGQLFRDQALTVTFALVFSLIVALTLIPMLAAVGAGDRFQDSTDPRPPGRFTRFVAGFIVGPVRFVIHMIGKLFYMVLWPVTKSFQVFYNAVASFYAPALAWSLRNRLLVLLAATGMFVSTMSLVPQLGTELIPQLSQGEFAVDVKLAPGAPLVETDRTILQVERAAVDLENMDLTYSVAGTGNRLDANPVDAGENTGKLNIRLIAGADRQMENAAMATMRANLQRLPGVQYKFSRPAFV